MSRFQRATLIVLACCIAACAFAVLARSAVKASPVFPTVVQAANGAVTISVRPTRVVSLSATATEDLFAIGAGGQVIAVDDQSNFPAQAPRTSLSGYRPNAEAIASYNPDLVIVSSDGGIVDALQKLSITVLLEPAAANLGQAYQEITQLGAATGHAQTAGIVVKGMQVALTKLVRSVPRPKTRLTVFHELSPDLYSATSQTFIGQIYRIFGFINIADAAGGASQYPKLSGEYVLARNPDLVVLSDTKCCGQSAATVLARPGWADISAVKHGRVVAVSDDIASRWGPRIVDFTRLVAKAALRG